MEIIWFFPSHVFLQQVYERYLRCYAVKDDTECLVQTEHMDEAEREAFCSALREIPEWTCPILSIWKSKWRKKAVWLASACWVGFFRGDRFKGGQPDRRADCRNRTAAGLHGTGDYSGIFRGKRRKWF